ncbi:hypothetical protein FDUTEX481_04285 [Tolypothrix sp. PCC 7601]|nr:hypothetical protein FDUTEX481_04285 [Tolypothrix sp. PCC 7601]
MSVKGKRGRGKGERKNLEPLPFHLFPKPNSKLKILNRAVLRRNPVYFGTCLFLII